MLVADSCTCVLVNSLVDSSIIYNTATGSGGGVYVEFSSLTMESCKLSNNLAHVTGGALWCLGDRAHHIATSSTTDNAALVQGGGFYAVYCNLDFVSSSFISNTAQQGGAIALGSEVFSTT